MQGMQAMREGRAEDGVHALLASVSDFPRPPSAAPRRVADMSMAPGFTPNFRVTARRHVPQRGGPDGGLGGAAQAAHGGGSGSGAGPSSAAPGAAPSAPTAASEHDPEYRIGQALRRMHDIRRVSEALMRDADLLLPHSGLSAAARPSSSGQGGGPSTSAAAAAATVPGAGLGAAATAATVARSTDSTAAGWAGQAGVSDAPGPSSSLHVRHALLRSRSAAAATAAAAREGGDAAEEDLPTGRFYSRIARSLLRPTVRHQAPSASGVDQDAAEGRHSDQVPSSARDRSPLASLARSIRNSRGGGRDASGRVVGEDRDAGDEEREGADADRQRYREVLIRGMRDRTSAQLLRTRAVPNVAPAVPEGGTAVAGGSTGVERGAATVRGRDTAGGAPTALREAEAGSASRGEAESAAVDAMGDESEGSGLEALDEACAADRDRLGGREREEEAAARGRDRSERDRSERARVGVHRVGSHSGPRLRRVRFTSPLDVEDDLEAGAGAGARTGAAAGAEAEASSWDALSAWVTAQASEGAAGGAGQPTGAGSGAAGVERQPTAATSSAVERHQRLWAFISPDIGSTAQSGAPLLSGIPPPADPFVVDDFSFEWSGMPTSALSPFSINSAPGTLPPPHRTPYLMPPPLTVFAAPSNPVPRVPPPPPSPFPAPPPPASSASPWGLPAFSFVERPRTTTAAPVASPPLPPPPPFSGSLPAPTLPSSPPWDWLSLPPLAPRPEPTLQQQAQAHHWPPYQATRVVNAASRAQRVQREFAQDRRDRQDLEDFEDRERQLMRQAVRSHWDSDLEVEEEDDGNVGPLPSGWRPQRQTQRQHQRLAGSDVLQVGELQDDEEEEEEGEGELMQQSEQAERRLLEVEHRVSQQEQRVAAAEQRMHEEGRRLLAEEQRLQEEEEDRQQHEEQQLQQLLAGEREQDEVRGPGPPGIAFSDLDDVWM